MARMAVVNGSVTEGAILDNYKGLRKEEGLGRNDLDDDKTKLQSLCLYKFEVVHSIRVFLRYGSRHSISSESKRLRISHCLLGYETLEIASKTR